MARLLATSSDRDRVAAAESVVLLVGSYDGSGNYGDVLQLAAAIRALGRLPGRPLPLAIVEYETAGHHRELMRRYGDLLGPAAFAHFEDGRGVPVAGLEELEDGLVSVPAVVHLYGGGYLNEWWGARKLEHHQAAGRLVGSRPLPATASGLQIEEGAVASGGLAHDLLSASSWVGLRDRPSLDVANARLARRGGAPPVLSGDDATPLISPPASEQAGWVVNLHLNLGGWVSDEPDALASTVVRILNALGDASDGALALQPVIAYEDPRVSESDQMRRFLDEHGPELEAHGLRPLPPLDILDDATRHDFEGFRRGRLTVSCSYHVALTSLLAAVPTVLPSSNPYYAQKAAGLRDLFDGAAELVGVQGSEGDLATAAAVLADGPARARSIAALRAGAARVVTRQSVATDGVLGALAGGLERSAVEAELRTALLHAEAAEARTRAIAGGRAWRAVTRLRKARDTLRAGIVRPRR